MTAYHGPTWSWDGVRAIRCTGDRSMNAVSIEELVDAGIDEDSILFMAHGCHLQSKSKSPRVVVFPPSAISSLSA